MIYPTASDILHCVNRTLADVSDSDLPRMSMKSALATSRHLLRHVELRMRLEASILRDDIAATTRLLGSLQDYLGSAAEAPESLLATIRDTLAAAGAVEPADGEPDELRQLGERAKALREAVYSSLRYLQAFSVAAKESAAYQTARDRIREYIAFEFAQEARIVKPAFAGHGPRR